MKLLLDANLSPKLVGMLSPIYSGSAHVHALGIARDDRAIWDFARLRGYVIVSKDADFYALSITLGAPPKVVWLRVGNAGTNSIRDVLEQRVAEIQALVANVEASLLVLDGP